MTPRDDLRFGGTQYVLAKPGDSYIAYASALAGDIGLEERTAGSYDVQWLDCATGESVVQTGVSVGAGDQSWTRPAGIGNELAVYITRTPLLFAASPPPAPVADTDAPHIPREEIEWLNVWLPGNNVKVLPRVLLIGDSITQGYYNDVTERLKGTAVVARLTTSKSSGDAGLLAEVRLVVSQTRFDAVHFNNGLHGCGYSEQQYAEGLPELIETIREGAPEAKLVWTAITPLRIADHVDHLAPRNERVKARNKLAAEVIAAEKIPINDLYSLLADKPQCYSRDGTHSNEQGKAALGAQVADHVLRVLPAATP